MTDTFFENNDCTVCMMEGDARAKALSGDCEKPYDTTIEGFRGGRRGGRRGGWRRGGYRRGYWGGWGWGSPYWGWGSPYYYPRTTVIKQQAPATNGTYKTVAWVALTVAVMAFLTSRK